MLRLSKKADYALMAMKHLALRGRPRAAGSTSAREIAELYDIPIELMAKVLQRLVRRGLLASQQGTRGGYQLARRAVADFGRRRHPGDRWPGHRHCVLDRRRQCDQFAKCNVRDPLWRVRERILAALGECTIAELAADPPSPAPAQRRGAAHAFVRAGLKGSIAVARAL